MTEKNDDDNAAILALGLLLLLRRPTGALDDAGPHVEPIPLPKTGPGGSSPTAPPYSPASPDGEPPANGGGFTLAQSSPTYSDPLTAAPTTQPGAPLIPPWNAPTSPYSSPFWEAPAATRTPPAYTPPAIVPPWNDTPTAPLTPAWQNTPTTAPLSPAWKDTPTISGAPLIPAWQNTPTTAASTTATTTAPAWTYTAPQAAPAYRTGLNHDSAQAALIGAAGAGIAGGISAGGFTLPAAAGAGAVAAAVPFPLLGLLAFNQVAQTPGYQESGYIDGNIPRYEPPRVIIPPQAPLTQSTPGSGALPTTITLDALQQKPIAPQYSAPIGPEPAPVYGPAPAPVYGPAPAPVYGPAPAPAPVVAYDAPGPAPQAYATVETPRYSGSTNAVIAANPPPPTAPLQPPTPAPRASWPPAPVTPAPAPARGYTDPTTGRTRSGGR